MSNISSMGKNKIMRKYNGIFQALCVFLGYVIEYRLFQKIPTQVISADDRHTLWYKGGNLNIGAKGSHRHLLCYIKNCSCRPLGLLEKMFIQSNCLLK